MKDNIKKVKILFKDFLLPAILYEFEEWKFLIWDTDLDDTICCDGNMCACAGDANRKRYS